MKKRIYQLTQNKVLTGSLVLLVGSNIYNASQFVFHFLSGRFLGVANYGDLATIISLLGIIGIIHSAVNLSVIKYIASYKTPDQIKAFASWIHHRTLLIAGLGMIIVLIASPLFISFLQLSTPALAYLLAPLMFCFVIITTWRAILQGLHKFNLFAASLSLEAVVKLIFFGLFLMVGWQVLGAAGAMILSVIVAGIFTYLPLKSYLQNPGKIAPDIEGFFKYSLVALLQGLALTSMYSTDLLLVKHYFNAEQAGVYASLAILGRVVFFGITPIAQVMFPIVVARHTDNQPYRLLFLGCLGIVSLMVIILVGLYSTVPAFIISLLYGQAFSSGASMLWWFALTLGMLGVSNLFIQFYLSIGKTKIVGLFVLSAILQIVLILLYHQTLLQVVQMSAISCALLLLGLLLYFPYHNRNEKLTTIK